MHTQRFAQRLVALADTPEKVQAIVDTLAACVTTQQITRKDVIHLTQQLRALWPQKPQLRAPRVDILSDHQKYEFSPTQVLGMEVKDGDLLYKRTLGGDIDKLL
jgi:hypothetical protein